MLVNGFGGEFFSSGLGLGPDGSIFLVLNLDNLFVMEVALGAVDLSVLDAHVMNNFCGFSSLVGLSDHLGLSDGV